MKNMNQIKRVILGFFALFIINFFFVYGCHAQKIIPQPVSLIKGNGDYVLQDKITIGYNNNSLKDAADYIASIFRPSTGLKLRIQKRSSDIMLSIDKSIVPSGYNLQVTTLGIAIKGGDYRGVVNGLQTLRQLLPYQVESKQKITSVIWKVPICNITDYPHFEYRGLMLDVSRHFYTKQEVKEVLDFMALYKMNKFHWHLTDDQGWRIEIKRYPKLTQNGAWRKYNSQDKECLRRAKDEDNIDFLIPTDREKTVSGERLYGGYYTQNDIREIIDYARVRGIDVIPEIDMPGHMLAAEENYKGLACNDDIGFKFFSSPICPGKESAMEFCKKVYDEVASLFPYEYVHIGGDEVEKTNWKNCADCQKRIKEKGLKSEEELQSWFIHEMEKYLNSKGRKIIGWNEIIEGGLSNTSTIMWWGSWVKDVPEVTTAHGNNLIFTPNSHFYLDYAQGADDLKKIYNYDLTAGLPLNKQKYILGVQGNIWCENIPSKDRMFYMSSTRALAIAELGWTSSEPKNYYFFEDRFLDQLPRLRQMNVKYRTMDLEGLKNVNSFVGEGVYNITCKDSSVTVRYSNDGSFPNEQSQLLKNLLHINNSSAIIFRTFYPDGTKGDMVKASFIKDNYGAGVNVQPKKNGLVTEWYDFSGSDVNNIGKSKFNETYFTTEVQIPDGVKGNIGLIISGYIYVKQDDVLSFELTSDDGSDMYIDGNKLIDMNREQSPVTSVAEKALAKGYHEIRIRYFDHNGGMLKLIIKDSKGNTLNPNELYYCK